MSLISLAAALALSLVDPTGDAAGDGTLEPPTSPVYANAALFDLQELSVAEGTSEGDPATLRVAMGAVEVDESQPAGFNRAVVDVYLDFVDGGADATLAGPGMLMPPGRGWDFAVRVSPRGAFGAPAPLDDGQAVEWAPLEMALDGDVFVVSLPAEVPSDLDAYAMSGVYDAFSRDSWRLLASSPSPWSYSGTEQVVPVIDVIAGDHTTQMRALRAGVLPAPSRQAADGLPWLLLSMAGVLIAATGLWLRRLVGAAVVSPETAGAMGDPDPEEAPREPDAEAEAEVQASDVEPDPDSQEPIADPEPIATALEPDVGEDECEPVLEPDVDTEDADSTEPGSELETGTLAEEDSVRATDRWDDGADGEDVFGRVGRELADADEEEEDELLDFVGRRGRSLRVENTEDESGPEGS